MKNIQPEPVAENIWDLIDAVLVINLEHRTDRWERIQQHTKNLIPQEKLHRIPAILGKKVAGAGTKPWFRGHHRDAAWAGKAGCTLSHRKALETIVHSDWETVLILEDDIELIPDFEELSSKLANTLSAQSDDWDICYLGFTDPWGPFRKINQINTIYSLYQVFGCLCAHAYLIKKTTAEKVYAQLPNEHRIWSWVSVHRIIDRWYLRHLGRYFKVTCVTPSIVNQYADYSDIIQCNTDYAHSNKHSTAVPEEKTSTSSYPFKYHLRKLRISHLLFSDFMRGQIKRFRGF